VESAYVFTSFAGKGRPPTPRPLDRSAALRVVRHYARQVGLQHISPHSFRHFVGTEVAKKSGIRQAQLVLGHKDISSTARYVHDELAGGLTDGLY